MAIVNISLSSPAVGATRVSGTFATDAAAALTTTTSGNSAVGQANIGVASSIGLSARYLTWPLGGASGADGIVAVLGSFTATTIAIQSPGLQTATSSGTVLTRWEQLLASGYIRSFAITQANGDVFTWAAGDPSYELKKIPSGGTQTVLANAVIVVPEQIHFAPGVLPASTTFTITMEISA